MQSMMKTTRAPRAAQMARSAQRVQRQRFVVMNVATGDGKPTVLVAEKLGSAGIELLKQYATVDTSYDLKPEELNAKISLCDALIVRSATKVNRAVFEASKGRLKVVGRAGVGVDNVDLAAATEFGCLVVNAPTANTVAAAEHGIALICSLARNVAQADASMKRGEWKRNKYVGASLVDKTLAVFGFGKVGSEVARRANGLGMKVIAFDPYATPERAAAANAELVSFEEALARGDFFSLHMPLTDSTKNLFNDDAFKLIKKGARIVNVARGGVIDEAALARALDAGIVAGAALDVFQQEPPAFDSNPLVGRPEVICTPHLGASTTEAQEGVSVEVVEAVVDALSGKLASTAVNAPMVPAEILKELQPYVTLAEGLGKAAVSLSASGFSDISITYSSPRGDDLDTRLLRAMVLKGVLESVTTSNVNLVNADLLAKQRGIRVSETTVSAEGNEVLSSLSVSLNTSASKFSAAVDTTGRIFLQGVVRGTTPIITKLGNFNAELSVQGSALLCRQRDQPGIVGAIGTLLSKGGVNISFMSVVRTARNKEAIMTIGIDETPSKEILDEIKSINGIAEWVVFKELSL